LALRKQNPVSQSEQRCEFHVAAEQNAVNGGQQKLPSANSAKSFPNRPEDSEGKNSFQNISDL